MLAFLLLQIAACAKTDVVLHDELLSVDPAALDVGEVYSSEIEWDVPITNESSRVIEVSSVVGTCDCTSISPRHFSIAPGATETLRIRLNLAGKSGPFSIGVTASLAGDDGSLVWSIHGQVKPLFRKGGAMVRMQYPSVNATVSLELAEPVSSLNVSADSALLNVSSQLVDDSVNVSFHLLDDVPFGVSHVQLRFEGVDTSMRRFQVVFPIRVDRVAPYVVRPKILNLGKISRGTTAESVVFISSGFDLSGFSLVSSPDGVVVTSVGQHASDVVEKNLALEVQVVDVRLGLQSLEVAATVFVGSREVPVVIPVSYFGE